MGSGSLSVVLAWSPAHTAVLAALNVGNLIQQPAVLLGAAAIVVVAVLIVLIMVLRGGSKKVEMASEVEDDQQPWGESAPQAAVGQSGRGYDPRDQMLPWEQGGARADGGRPPMGGKRGAMPRDPQAGWGQPEDYQERDAQWDAPGQAMPRGGQWPADQWAPAESPAGRGGNEQRAPQSQMPSRNQESWGWGAGQAAGPQGVDEWGQGAAAPAASFSMGNDADQWGQRRPPASPAMGRENDEWGQRPAGPPAMGRDADQWGQAAPPSALGRENDQWGQPKPSSSMGWDNNQWGQGAAAPAMGRENDEWGQGASPRGRSQDQWGQPAPAMGRAMEQPEDQGVGNRSRPRRGPDAGDQAEGQWRQGSWNQNGVAWEANGAPDRWSQAAQPSQAGRSPQPAANPNGQGNMGGMSGPSASGGEWGAQNLDRPGQSGAQPGGAWGTREPPAWQAEPRQEPPAWEAPAQRSPSSSRPQWEQAGHPGAESAWQSGQGADEWGQPAQGPKPSASRPVEPAGARGASQPPAPAAEWSERDFERPTARPGQSGNWEQREAPARQSPPEPAAPARQSSAPSYMAAPVIPPESPPERRAPDARQVPSGSPDDTAYGPPASGGDSEGEAAKTVVMRKDAPPGRTPAVVVRQGKEPGRAYDMRKEQIRIGRSRESDIFLEDLAVSRLHATIYRDEMGVYQLRDENSANGTSVNGQRVTECALQEGDEIQLGQTILAFVRR